MSCVECCRWWEEGLVDFVMSKENIFVPAVEIGLSPCLDKDEDEG